MPTWNPYPNSGSGGGAAGSGAKTIINSLFTTTIANAGQAQTALEPGQRSLGGWLALGPTAGGSLGINEHGGDAAGSDNNGDTFFIYPGQSYTLQASSLGVSVISDVGGLIYGGLGLS